MSQLMERLSNYANENPVVRHEAAEALGSIADNESNTLLKQFVVKHVDR